MFLFLKLAHFLQPILGRIFPPLFIIRKASFFRAPFLKRLAKASIKAEPALYPVKLKCGLTFRNDLGVAAGFDKDGKLLPFLHSLGAGFVVVGTVLPRAHSGNLPKELGGKLNPWIPLPLSRSAVNSLGLPQSGVDETVQNLQKFRAQMHDENFRIGASVMSHPLDHGEAALQNLLSAVRKLAPLVDFFELNESCPNVAHASSLEEQQKRVQSVQKVCAEFSRPLFIKLAHFGDVKATLRFFAQQKVAGLVGVNTQTDYEALRQNICSSEQKLFNYYTEHFRGGVSGKAIQEIARAQIAQASLVLLEEKLPLDLIHVGGIFSPQDVQESRKFAVLREWYTGLMEGLAKRDAKTLYRDMLRPQ